MERDIRCQEIVELVTSYLEGALGPASTAAIEAHLVTCPGCVAYLEQMRTTIALTGALEPSDVPDAVMEDLLAAFRTYRPPA